MGLILRYMSTERRVAALTTSHCLFKRGSASKLSAYLITQQQSKSYGVMLLARRHKQVEAGLRGFFASGDIPKVEETFGRSAIVVHYTRLDGSDLKWKRISLLKERNIYPAL